MIHVPSIAFTSIGTETQEGSLLSPAMGNLAIPIAMITKNAATPSN